MSLLRQSLSYWYQSLTNLELLQGAGTNLRVRNEGSLDGRIKMAVANSKMHDTTGLDRSGQDKLPELCCAAATVKVKVHDHSVSRLCYLATVPTLILFVHCDLLHLPLGPLLLFSS